MTMLEQLSELVTTIYDPVLDSSLWEQTLQGIVSAVGGNAGGQFIFDRRRGHRHWLVQEGVLDLVEQWRHGCVLASLDDQVFFANRAANNIAASRDGLSLGCRGLHATVRSEDAALQHLIRQACIGYGDGIRSGGRLAISRGSGRKPYAIQVMPLRPRHTNFSNGPLAALVLIVDLEGAVHLPPEDLQKLYDLTPAEAEVAVSVLRGHGLQSVADELRVTLSTVRVHLQRVFEKTGTHRQAELVRLLFGLEAINVPGRLDEAAE